MNDETGMEKEDGLKAKLAAWRAVPPPVDLAARIAQRATALPQRKPWGTRILAAAERALTEWRYGLVYKLATLALCAAFGFAAGTYRAESVDIVALAFGAGAGESL
ncbi:MAG TPA: hypothetical protein VMT29_16300 [Steroidobacteraceae bacterium]|nr:hypothetical protein [Steroidobacteraceae bacterium]